MIKENPKTPKTSLENISASMREFAFKNPLLTIEAVQKGISSGQYTSTLVVGNTVLINVILSISPTDDEKEYFWHCSISFINKLNGFPRKSILLTKRERVTLRTIANRFLENVGKTETQKFSAYRYGFHLYRDLTDTEREKIMEAKVNAN